MIYKPLVSVIIPTFNRKQTLFRAIDSVLKQTFKDFDIWIIDDGSNDGTFELLEPYIKEYEGKNKIYYLQTENKGVSSARNFGINSSAGECLAFLDSDDEWLPDKLMKQVEFIKNNPDIPLVHGEEIWIRKGKRVNPKVIHKKFGGDIFLKSLALCLISPSATMLNRKLFEVVGLFDEEFIVCEDYDLWLKITSLYDVGFLTEPIIIKHGGHPDQLSAKFFAMDYWRIKSLNRIKKIRKLSPDKRKAVDNMIQTKSKVLLNGYIKHGNMKHYSEIYKINSQASYSDRHI